MLITGIGGGTGSAKTTLAELVAEHLAPGKVAVIKQDSYYLDRNDMPLSERKKANFDHPDAFDMELLVSHIAALKRGETIEQPVYGYKTHTRSRETRSVEPCDVVLLEGILAFQPRELRRLMDLKIYVDAPDDVRFIRRLQRDIRERGRTVEDVIEQYYDTVRPMHLNYVEPMRQCADLVVSGEGDPTVAAEKIVAAIRAAGQSDSASKLTALYQLSIKLQHTLVAV